jgi:hypothetical protein
MKLPEKPKEEVTREQVLHLKRLTRTIKARKAKFKLLKQQKQREDTNDIDQQISSIKASIDKLKKEKHEVEKLLFPEKM